jgi:hypothetical protein
MSVLILEKRRSDVPDRHQHAAEPERLGIEIVFREPEPQAGYARRMR